MSNAFTGACIFCAALTTFAATELGGVLQKDTRLKVAEGPFILRSDLIVPANTRLTISPGVTIIIHPGGTNDTSIAPFDALEETLISIRIIGTLSCIGKRDAHITLQADSSAAAIAWYGIIFENTDDQFNEIAFTSISSAYCGVTLKKSSSCVRNTLLEYNTFGMTIDECTNVLITNCAIIYNRNSGLRVVNSNSVITNNIIAFNKNNGVWCDGKAEVDIKYNCIAENHDGNFFECDPELGVSVNTSARGDSIDTYNNIGTDPVLFGSVAEARAMEKDPALPTNVSSVKNKVIAAIITATSKKETPAQPVSGDRYSLSHYSPCKDAGDPAGKYRDTDGSRNDIGLHGGPDLLDRK